MTDGGSGLGSAERLVCEDTLPLHAHWHYNIETVSATITWLTQPNDINRRTLFTHPREPPTFYSYHDNSTFNRHTEDMFKVKGGCTRKRGTRFLTGKYQRGQRGTGLTTE